MSMRLIDLIGMRFGRWTVLALHPERQSGGHVAWLCRCDCGTEGIVRGSSLRRGWSTSCDCFHRERLKKAVTKHGMYKTRIYRIWQAAKQRCFNKRNKFYCDYGARGVGMYSEWRDDFMAFFRHMGHPPTDRHTLHRIDNDGDYAPGNCKWAAAKEQANNRRPPRQKRRRSDIADIRVLAAALARAASADGVRGAP